jgi:hypothetical protein
MRNNILWLICLFLTIVLLYCIFTNKVITQIETFNQEQNEKDNEEDNEEDTNNVSTQNIEILIARYNEDLEWLKNKPFSSYPITIYNKGVNDNFYKPSYLKEVVELPNVGVNVHSYLYYIIENYDNLPDVVIFLPGSAMDKHKRNKTLKTVLNTISTNNSVFYVEKNIDYIKETLNDFNLDIYPISNLQNRELNNDYKLEKCNIRPFGKWYDYLFPNISLDHINYHAIFSVSREHILNRSKKSYKKLIKYVNNHKNEECAHYFERSFLSIFHPIPDECIYTL